MAYLKDLLPHLGRGGVRLVHSPVGYKNIDQASDLYDQVAPPSLVWLYCKNLSIKGIVCN